jgi:hypothetical protein
MGFDNRTANLRALRVLRGERNRLWEGPNDRKEIQRFIVVVMWDVPTI